MPEWAHTPLHMEFSGLDSWMPWAHPADIVLEDGQVLQDVVLHRAHVRRAHLPGHGTALSRTARTFACNQNISC